MLTRLRTRFGTAGLIVAIVALVAAIGGTALAASGALSGKQKKEVEKIAKKFAGKPGAAGAQGPAGANGTPGAKGDTGAAGANGTNGKDGTNGTNGISPTGTAFAGAKGGCTEGGVEFKGANTTLACNGVKGTNGTTGFTKTLPKGETLSGTWSAGMNGAIVRTYETEEAGKKVTLQATSFTLTSISFGIPLAEPPTALVYLTRELTDCSALSEPQKKTCEEANTALEKKCPGNYSEPAAAPGFLCLYEAPEELGPGTRLKWTSLNNLFSAGTMTKSGATLFFSPPTSNSSGLELGSWAVTAPTA